MKRSTVLSLLPQLVFPGWGYLSESVCLWQAFRPCILFRSITCKGQDSSLVVCCLSDTEKSFKIFSASLNVLNLFCSSPKMQTNKIECVSWFLGKNSPTPNTLAYLLAASAMKSEFKLKPVNNFKQLFLLFVTLYY